MRFPLLFVLLAALGGGPAAQTGTQRPPETVHARHFRLSSGPDEERRLESAAVPGSWIALGADTAVFGPDGRCAVLDAAPVAGERGVRLLDARLQPEATFTVPADRELTLGTAGLVLSGRSEHALGTAYRLEFRDLLGIRRSSAQDPERVLLGVRALDDGRWITHAVDAQGTLTVEAFGPTGEPRWRLDRGHATAPVVVAAPRGGWTAVAVLEEDFSGSRLAIVDARGTVRAEAHLPVLRSVRFDETGTLVAVGGGRSVSLLRTADAWRLWTLDLDAPLVLGNPLSFTGDGRTLRVLTQPQDDSADGPEPLVLVECPVVEGPARTTRRELVEVGPRPRGAVLQLSEANGTWRLLTRDGVWTWND